MATGGHDGGDLAAGAGLVWLLLRRKRGGARDAGQRGFPPMPHAVGRLYRRCLERLARGGLARGLSETQREHAARVVAAGVEGAAAFRELTELYLDARFGRRDIDEARVAALARQLTRLGEPLETPSSGGRVDGAGGVRAA